MPSDPSSRSRRATSPTRRSKRDRDDSRDRRDSSRRRARSRDRSRGRRHHDESRSRRDRSRDRDGGRRTDRAPAATTTSRTTTAPPPVSSRTVVPITPTVAPPKPVGSTAVVGTSVTATPTPPPAVAPAVVVGVAVPRPLPQSVIAAAAIANSSAVAVPTAPAAVAPPPSVPKPTTRTVKPPASSSSPAVPGSSKRDTGDPPLPQHCRAVARSYPFLPINWGNYLTSRAGTDDAKLCPKSSKDALVVDGFLNYLYCDLITTAQENYFAPENTSTPDAATGGEATTGSTSSTAAPHPTMSGWTAFMELAKKLETTLCGPKAVKTILGYVRDIHKYRTDAPRERLSEAERRNRFVLEEHRKSMRSKAGPFHSINTMLVTLIVAAMYPRRTAPALAALESETHSLLNFMQHGHKEVMAMRPKRGITTTLVHDTFDQELYKQVLGILLAQSKGRR